MSAPRTARVVTASNRAAAGVYPDRGGPLIVTWLRERGYETPDAAVVPDGDPVGEALRVAVAERRPSWQTGELHGLYQADEKGRFRVSLWMRTAQRAQVVKFKTFLRTLLHELCHHLDYQRLRLSDSFHTEGFYRRESSLLRQLHRDAEAKPGVGKPRLRGPSAGV